MPEQPLEKKSEPTDAELTSALLRLYFAVPSFSSGKTMDVKQRGAFIDWITSVIGFIHLSFSHMPPGMRVRYEERIRNLKKEGEKMHGLSARIKTEKAQLPDAQSTMTLMPDQLGLEATPEAVSGVKKIIKDILSEYFKIDLTIVEGENPPSDQSPRT